MVAPAVQEEYEIVQLVVQVGVPMFFGGLPGFNGSGHVGAGAVPPQSTTPLPVPSGAGWSLSHFSLPSFTPSPQTIFLAEQLFVLRTVVPVEQVHDHPARGVVVVVKLPGVPTEQSPEEDEKRDVKGPLLPQVGVALSAWQEVGDPPFVPLHCHCHSVVVSVLLGVSMAVFGTQTGEVGLWANVQLLGVTSQEAAPHCPGAGAGLLAAQEAGAPPLFPGHVQVHWLVVCDWFVAA
jgi:hypothetical protein